MLFLYAIIILLFIRTVLVKLFKEISILKGKYMLQIEIVEDSKVFIYLPNGKYSTFRTVEAAERMNDLIVDINSGNIKHLEVVEINEKEFDIYFTNEYLSNLKEWLTDYSDSSIHSNNRYFAEFRLNNRIVRLSPFSRSILFSQKDKVVWSNGVIEHSFKLPLTEGEFDNIIADVFTEQQRQL